MDEIATVSPQYHDNQLRGAEGHREACKLIPNAKLFASMLPWARRLCRFAHLHLPTPPKTLSAEVSIA